MMTLRRKFSIGGILLVATVFSLAGCTRATDRFAGVPGKGPKVLVSFPALYSLTKGVAGEHAQVVSLLSTSEPHDYSPTAADAVAVKQADVLIINGLGLDDRFIAIQKSAGNTKLRFVNLGELLEEQDHDLLLHAHEAAGHDHGHKEKDKGHHHGGEHDPHIWLGIEQAKVMVHLIADELCKAAPEHKAAYHENAKAYAKKLDELHQHGLKQFSDKKNKRIVATHDSMGYFAKSFKLDVVDSLMPQPGVDADAKKLQELVKLCTDKDTPVRVITVEPQYTDRTAKALMTQIKNELKKKTPPQDEPPALVTFDTMETAAETNFPADLYFIKMRENIDNLAKALK